MKGLITLGVGQGGDIGLWALVGLTPGAAVVVPEPEPDTGGATTGEDGLGRRRSARDTEIALQRRIAMAMRQRQEAEAERMLEAERSESKSQRKKRARKAYITVASALEDATDAPEVLNVARTYAPALSESLTLPPEKMILFDKLIEDNRAMTTLYVAYLEQIRLRALEEEAIVAALLMTQ